jgi:hypothetical protein
VKSEFATILVNSKRFVGIQNANNFIESVGIRFKNSWDLFWLLAFSRLDQPLLVFISMEAPLADFYIRNHLSSFNVERFSGKGLEIDSFVGPFTLCHWGYLNIAAGELAGIS